MVDDMMVETEREVQNLDSIFIIIINIVLKITDLFFVIFFFLIYFFYFY